MFSYCTYLQHDLSCLITLTTYNKLENCLRLLIFKLAHGAIFLTQYLSSSLWLQGAIDVIKFYSCVNFFRAFYFSFIIGSFLIDAYKSLVHKCFNWFSQNVQDFYEV